MTMSYPNPWGPSLSRVIHVPFDRGEEHASDFNAYIDSCDSVSLNCINNFFASTL
jgi:hypothetical protein